MSTGSKTTISKKMCLIGAFGVGKTSLIRRFVDRQFSDQYLSTVGVTISRKLVDFQEPPTKNLQLLSWDLEGSTNFKAIAPSDLQGAQAASTSTAGTRLSQLFAGLGGNPLNCLDLSRVAVDHRCQIGFPILSDRRSFAVAQSVQLCRLDKCLRQF